jgi:hypothetical protein
MANQHHIAPKTREEAFHEGLEPPFDHSGISKHWAMEESCA